MAYLSSAQQLDGLLDWIPKLAAPAAIAAVPIPAPIKAGLLALKPLQVSKPSLPPLFDQKPAALPPTSKPLPMPAPAPKAGPTPAVNQVQNVVDMVSSALASMRSNERPLATAIGTDLPQPTPLVSAKPTATKVPQAPSGNAPTSAPVDVETRAIVNSAGQTMIPIPAPAMPAWVIPAAIIGGGALLYMLARR